MRHRPAGRHKRAGKFILLAALSFLMLVPSVGQGAAKSKLGPEEQKVVEYLSKDWGADYSVTSVDLAMAAVGLAQSDETRFRIGSYVKAHPELHEVLRNWGWVTVVLTADEKLIARALVNAERDGKAAPSLSEIAKAVAISEDHAKRGLAMLERYEIIRRDREAGGAGYKVVAHYLKWEPRLDFIFHTVTLAGGRKFNTN
jgi:hypothetical protein